MRCAAALFALVLLTGCGEPRDVASLKGFVRDADKGLPRRIEPLPAFPAKGEPYTAANLPDPFNPRGAAVGGARK